MRQPRLLYLLLAFITVLSSCKTNNDVVSNGLIQKRKHLQGFHWNGFQKAKKVDHPSDERTIVLEDISQRTQEHDMKLPGPVTSATFSQEQAPTAPLMAAASERSAFSTIAHHLAHKRAPLKRLETMSVAPDAWNKADFKKKSAVKRRSAFSLFLSIMGALLFAFLAINSFAAILSSGVLLLTILQLSLLFSGLMFSWKHKDTNGASRAAFILAWIFLGLTGLFYFGLIVGGML